MDLSRKALAFEVKALADDGSFELYAAVFNNVDRQDELIAPGAFVNLDEFARDGWGDVNHAWNGLGVATIDEAVQDSIGLKVRGRFHSTADAQDVRTKLRERMERGKACKCSIGFRVLDDAMETRGTLRVRVLKAIEVYEFSFVAMPANPAAGVTGVKGLIGLDEVRDRLAELKSGRAISKANKAKLVAWCGSMSEHGKAACKLADEMGAWLAEHDDEPDADDAETGKAAKLAELKRAQLGRRFAATCPY